MERLKSIRIIIEISTSKALRKKTFEQPNGSAIGSIFCEAKAYIAHELGKIKRGV